MGQVFKALYLVSFYSFLRLSNLVPHSVQQISALEDLARGDAIFHCNKVLVLLKWSKTMQSNNDIKLITILQIPNSSICPVMLCSRGEWPDLKWQLTRQDLYFRNLIVIFSLLYLFYFIFKCVTRVNFRSLLFDDGS